MLNLHGLDVHDLAAVFALSENAFPFFPSHLEVLFIAAITGKFPIIFIFFCYHFLSLIYIDFGLLISTLQENDVNKKPAN